MPINKQLKAIEDKLGLVKKVRDCIAGQEVIKSQENIETYLPKLKGQEGKHRKVYTNTPIFLEATTKASGALSSIINRKEPTINASKLVLDKINEITTNKEDFTVLSQNIVEEIVAVGTVVLCLDRDSLGDLFIAEYSIESLINYEFYNNNGNKELKNIVLKEQYIYEKDSDEFSKVYRTQYRHYKLAEKKGIKFVEVEVWRAENDNKYKIHTKTILTKGNKKLDFIPVVIVGLTRHKKLKNPPLSGIAHVNLSHFISEAYHENILYFHSAPIINIYGIDGKTGKIDLAPGNVTITPGEKSGIRYVEVTGKGAESIANKLEEKLKLIAQIGANIISSVQSAGTNIDVAKMNQAGSNATLFSIASDVSSGLTSILKMISMWEGEDAKVTKDISFQINTDFISLKATPNEIKAWVYSYMNSGMSRETLMWNMQQGEMHKPGTTIEDEIELIENEIINDNDNDNNDNNDE